MTISYRTNKMRQNSSFSKDFSLTTINIKSSTKNSLKYLNLFGILHKTRLKLLNIIQIILLAIKCIEFSIKTIKHLFFNKLKVCLKKRNIVRN